MNESVSRLGWAGILAILGSGVAIAIPVGTISLVLPAISDHFFDGRNGIYIKMVATSLGLGMMVGAPLSGIIADRIGCRRVLIAAISIMSLCGLSILFASELSQIIIARFFIGMMAGATGTCVIALISEHFAPEDQARWLGVSAAVSCIAIVACGPLTGTLADSGWRNGFLIYALLLPLILPIAIGIPATTRSRRAGLRIGKIGTWPRIIPWVAIALAIVVGTLATGTSLYWPFRFREMGISSAREIALYAVPNFILVCVGGLAYGYIRRFLTINLIFIFAGVGSCLGLLIVGCAQDANMAMIGLALEGLSVGVLSPNLANFAISIARPDSRAQTIGLVKGAFYGGPFLTQFGLERMNGIGGTSLVLLCLSVLAALMAAILVVSSALTMNRLARSR